MAIIELHLDRPALKRVEPSPGTETTSEETEVVTGASERESEQNSGGGGIMRKVMLAALVTGVAFAAMRWRRGSSEEETAIDIGTEETRPTTE